MIWRDVDQDKLEKREKNDHYPTDRTDVGKGLRMIGNVYHHNRALDVGCGDGVWGDTWKREHNPEADVVGVDIQSFVKPTTFSEWYMGFDFVKYGTKENLGEFELVMGNPPYKFAQEFIVNSYDLLSENGSIIMLLRLAFLESQKRFEFFKLYKPREVRVMSKRPSFTGDGKTYPMAFAFYRWDKGWSGDTKLTWCLD